jgi:hypothetical protein
VRVGTALLLVVPLVDGFSQGGQAELILLPPRQFLPEDQLQDLTVLVAGEDAAQRLNSNKGVHLCSLHQQLQEVLNAEVVRQLLFDESVEGVVGERRQGGENWGFAV